MMTVEQRKYADGRIQAQISMSAHRFLRDHKYPNEPLYVTLDRIISMHKASDIYPYVEEVRKLKTCLVGMEEMNHTYKTQNEKLKKIVDGLDKIKRIEDFTNGI